MLQRKGKKKKRKKEKQEEEEKARKAKKKKMEDESRVRGYAAAILREGKKSALGCTDLGRVFLRGTSGFVKKEWPE